MDDRGKRRTEFGIRRITRAQPGLVRPTCPIWMAVYICLFEIHLKMCTIILIISKVNLYPITNAQTAFHPPKHVAIAQPKPNLIRIEFSEADRVGHFFGISSREKRPSKWPVVTTNRDGRAADRIGTERLRPDLKIIDPSSNMARE